MGLGGMEEDARGQHFNETGYSHMGSIEESARNMGVSVEEYNQIAEVANEMGVTPEEYLMMMEQAEEEEAAGGGNNPYAELEQNGQKPWEELGMTEQEYRNMMAESDFQ